MADNIITPLYKRDQWVRWQKLFEGTESVMASSFDKWLENHVKLVQEAKIRGNTVQEIEVDIDEYLAWTKQRRLPINGYTRTDFPGFIWHQRMYPGTNYDTTPPVA